MCVSGSGRKGKGSRGWGHRIQACEMLRAHEEEPDEAKPVL